MCHASLSQQEGVLRHVNEAIERGFWPGEGDAVVRIRCECGHADCNQSIRMRVDEYEQLRRQPRRFVLCEDHDTPAIERIVDRGEAYVIVEKFGSAGEAAERSDPRRDQRGEEAST